MQTCAKPSILNLLAPGKCPKSTEKYFLNAIFAGVSAHILIKMVCIGCHNSQTILVQVMLWLGATGQKVEAIT